MRIRYVLLSIAVLVLSRFRSGRPVAQQKEVVIGLLYPLSGPAASAGVDEKHVYELFADMVNGKEPMLPAPSTSSSRACPGSPGAPGSA